MKIHRHVMLAAISALFAAGCITPQPAPSPPGYLADDESCAAYVQLLNESVWINGNTYGPDASLENLSAGSLQVLWKHPRAADAFTALLDNAGPVGRLYALCGLYYADRKRFDAEVAWFRFEKDKVKSIFGDQYASERICDIVFCPYPELSIVQVSTCPPGCNPFLDQCPLHPKKKVLERTVRVVLKPDQTLQEWRKDNGGNGFYLDISGGGYPSLFKHGDVK